MSNSAPGRAAHGPSSVAPPPRRLRPVEVEAKFFEFFPKSAQRQVLFLDRLMDLLVHYLKDSRRKKLCTSEHGSCELCDVAAVSPEVEPCQAEYYAPAFVRRTGGPFEQKVVVFPAVSAIKLQELIPLDEMKGKLVEVTRKPSRVLVYKLLSELPRSIPSSLPQAFDVLPFIRARYGLPDDPTRPMQFLPPLKVDAEAKPVDRPARIRLSRQDADELSEKTVEELREYLAKCERNGLSNSADRVRELLASKGAPAPAAAEPVNEAPAAAEPVKPEPAKVKPTRPEPTRPEPIPSNDRGGFDALDGALGAVLGKQGAPGARGRTDALPLHPRTVSPKIMGESSLPDVSVETAKEMLQHLLKTGSGNSVEIAKLRAVIARGEVPAAEPAPVEASTTKPRIFDPEDPTRDEHGLSGYEYAMMATKGTAEIVCAEAKERSPVSHPINQPGRKAVP